MPSKRSHHTASLLHDGRILVVGGYIAASVAEGGGYSISDTCLLYDPAHDTWTPTARMVYPRIDHTATVLANGKVLVTGGQYGSYIPQCELYDPVAGTWSPAHSLSKGRVYHTATLLPSGKVLITGGRHSSGSDLATCSLYSPVGDVWATTATLATPRANHTATLLRSGKVLVTGGVIPLTGQPAASELYDPVLATWSPAGSPAVNRYLHTATLLPSGAVLVAGGYGGPYIRSTGGLTPDCELYDPATSTWSTTGTSGSMMRNGHRATLLGSGAVLASAGRGMVVGSISQQALNSSQLYGPQPMTNAPTITAVTRASGHRLILTGTGFLTGGSPTIPPAGDPEVAFEDLENGSFTVLPIDHGLTLNDTSIGVVHALTAPGRLWITANGAVSGGYALSPKAAPVISGTPPDTANTSELYTFTPAIGTPATGDAWTFSITDKPAWATFDPLTATLSGTPSRADAYSQTHPVIAATNSDQVAAGIAFSITVAIGFHPPTIGGTPATAITADSPYSFVPTTHDIDGDQLYFQVDNQPSWATFNSLTGTLSGTPRNRDAGSTGPITISVSDGGSYIPLPAFTVTVSYLNHPPAATAIDPHSTTAGRRLNWVLPAGTFSDADGDTLSLSAAPAAGGALPAWLTFDPVTTTLSGTPPTSAVGTLTIRFTANDGSATGSSDSDLTIAPASADDLSVDAQSNSPHCGHGLGSALALLLAALGWRRLAARPRAA